MAEETQEKALPEDQAAEAAATPQGDNRRSELAARASALIALADQARNSKGRGDTTDMDRVRQEIDQQRLEVGDPAVDLAIAFVESDMQEERANIELTTNLSAQQTAKDALENETITTAQAEKIRNDANEQAGQALAEIRESNPELAAKMDETKAQLTSDKDQTVAEGRQTLSRAEAEQGVEASAEEPQTSGHVNQIARRREQAAAATRVRGA